MKKKSLTESGLQIMQLTVAGGAVNNGVTFFFQNFIKINSIHVQNTGYVYFREIAGAKLDNSIIEKYLINGTSYALVNSTPATPYANGFYYFSIPLVVSEIEIRQSSAAGANINIFYESYVPV